MDVVGGAVEGVHDPGRRRVGAEPALGAGLLLAEEAVVGEAFLQVGAHGPLRAEVGVGHEVEARLLAHRELGAPLLQHGRAAAGGLAGGVEGVGEDVVREHGSLLMERTIRGERRGLSLKFTHKF